MKQLFLLSIIVFFMTLILSTCSESNDTEQPGRLTLKERVELLKDRLDLTEEQAKKLEQILVESEEKFAQLRDQFSGDRSAMRDTMRILREESDKLIEDLLNEEQKEGYEELKEERIQRMRQRFRDRNPEGNRQ